MPVVEKLLPDNNFHYVLPTKTNVEELVLTLVIH